MGKRIATGGRPSKGPRDLFVVRPTEAIGKLVRQEAEDLDLSYSELVARVLAEHYNLPPTNDIAMAGQGTLRMTG